MKVYFLLLCFCFCFLEHTNTHTRKIDSFFSLFVLFLISSLLLNSPTNVDAVTFVPRLLLVKITCLSNRIVAVQPEKFVHTTLDLHLKLNHGIKAILMICAAYKLSPLPFRSSQTLPPPPSSSSTLSYSQKQHQQ